MFSAGELWKRLVMILFFFIIASLNRTFPSWYSLQFGCEPSFRLDWLHIFNEVLHQVMRKDLRDGSKWNAWSVRVKEKKGKPQLLGWWPRGGSKGRRNQNMGYLASLWPVFPCTPRKPTNEEWPQPMWWPQFHLLLWEDAADSENTHFWNFKKVIGAKKSGETWDCYLQFQVNENLSLPKCRVSFLSV